MSPSSPWSAPVAKSPSLCANAILCTPTAHNVCACPHPLLESLFEDLPLSRTGQCGLLDSKIHGSGNFVVAPSLVPVSYEPQHKKYYTNSSAGLAHRPVGETTSCSEVDSLFLSTMSSFSKCRLPLKCTRVKMPVSFLLLPYVLLIVPTFSPFVCVC